MKSIRSATIMIIICTSFFLSCSKKKDVTTPPGKGSVVFWTKNAAHLPACSDNIAIRLAFPGPYGPSIVDSAHIISINASAPSSCSNIPSAIENIRAGFCFYQIKDCSTGLWRNIDSFSIITGVCRKIEVP